MSLDFAGWSVTIKMDNKVIANGFTESNIYELAIVDAVTEPSFHNATEQKDMAFTAKLDLEFFMHTSMPQGTIRTKPILSFDELQAENAFLRKQLSSYKIPKMQELDAKAAELFNIFQVRANSIRDTYCRSFDCLEKRQQESWRAVAQYILEQYQEK